jgi:hypothetical protein
MNRSLQRAGRCIAMVASVALLSACVALMPVDEGRKLIGSPQAAVASRFGPPPEVYALRDGTTRWIYSKQPLGQQAYAADFDRNGNLTDFRNMLETPELYKAAVGKWTKRDVQEHFGMTREPVQYYPRMQRDVWTYRFRHEGVWPSLFNFYFDQDGILRQTQITPDPLNDPDRRRW